MSQETTNPATEETAGQADDSSLLNQAEMEAMKEEVLKRSRDVLKKLPALGPIMLLYLQSDHRKFMFINDIEWLVLPPLMANQCKLFMNQDHPVSYVSWAFLSKENEQHLIKNAGKLRPTDWNSGDRIWLIDIVAPFGGVDEVLNDLRNNEFPGKTIRMLVPDPKTGGVMARELPAVKTDEIENPSIGSD